ncbi:MAG: hypothetical protein U0R24_10065 [Solirubrobacterales bacterium]
MTQIVVERTDPAFGNPTKPIGLAFDPAAAAWLTSEYCWSMRRDGGGFAASPSPRAAGHRRTGGDPFFVEAG